MRSALGTVFILFIVALVLGCGQDETSEVSLAVLLSRPELIGEPIRTKGFLSDSGGIVWLNLTREHADLLDAASAIRLGGGEHLDLVRARCDRVHAMVEGTFVYLEGIKTIHPVSRVVSYPSGAPPGVECWRTSGDA